MSSQRFPSVPLITCDPYFSIWSPADALYEADTCHWTSARKRITGYLETPEGVYRFLGAGEGPALRQTSLEVNATSSCYTFEGAGIALRVAFTTPLLPDDFELISRPCSYIDFAVSSLDGEVRIGKLRFSFDEELCCNGESRQPVTGGAHRLENYEAVWLGKRRQSPLAHSGDLITIDWGYLYLAARTGNAALAYAPGEARSELTAEYGFDTASRAAGGFVVGYDDIASINYFGDIKKGYWARGGKTILDALADALNQHDGLIERCGRFDRDLAARAAEAGGKVYARVCTLAWRQVIAAHKLIEDNDHNLVFISKECRSNGCSATSDISYPSVPMFLLYAPELVKGMLRPILKFARMPVWEYPFAPHDVGRYPYLTGQVYGAAHAECFEGDRSDTVYPPYYQYPRGSDAYKLYDQMPVEECGNMLIMAAALVLTDGDAAFVSENLDLWTRWADYLYEYGADPGEQLCTDDFAGHLAHNVNLAAKAVLGVEAYSILLRRVGREDEAAAWHKRAADMASDWTARARHEGHTSLVFGNAESWSIKYNLIWDLLFDSKLFPSDIFAEEVRWYLTRCNEFGVPLDNRASYTKSDWTLWAAALTDNRADMEKLISYLDVYLNSTPDRVPFSDWYDTITAKEVSFQNRTVQGGLFILLLKRAFAEKK